MFSNYIENINNFLFNDNPSYILFFILILLLIIYFTLGKLFTYIGFIFCMYYMYRYWKNRENVNKSIKKLFDEYKNILN
jgi:4-hydroxybenzoate polyprenyltransferase